MHYEIFTRGTDIPSEKITGLLVGRNLPFVEIRLGADEAESMEQRLGHSLPLVVHREKMVGSYSDLVNHLHHPNSQRRVPPPEGVNGNTSFSQLR